MEKILVLAGSNGSHSINQFIASQLAKSENVDYIDTRTLNLPYYSMDIEENEGIPQVIIDLYNKIHEYKKLIIVSPEYNGYTPAFLKSMLDWLSRYEKLYLDKIDVVIVCATPGKRAGASLRAMMTTMLSFTGANILGDYGIGEFNIDKDYSEDIKNILEMFK